VDRHGFANTQRELSIKCPPAFLTWQVGPKGIARNRMNARIVRRSKEKSAGGVIVTGRKYRLRTYHLLAFAAPVCRRNGPSGTGSGGRGGGGSTGRGGGGSTGCDGESGSR